MQSSLGDVTHCKYADKQCSSANNGLIIWNGNRTKECIFQEGIAIEGQNHGFTWLANDHQLALTFNQNGWQKRQVCPESRPDLLLLRSDQGIFVDNTTEIIETNFTGNSKNITWGIAVNQVTQDLAGYINSIATELSIEIQNRTKATFWDTIKSLCNHERMALMLLSRLVCENYYKMTISMPDHSPLMT
jgi:hypothetical protein